MPRDPDKLAIDDARWQVAVAREAVIRPLINAGQLSPVDVATACRILGLRRSRLYALIEQYRNAPVTTSLAAARPGPKKGARRLGRGRGGHRGGDPRQVSHPAKGVRQHAS